MPTIKLNELTCVRHGDVWGRAEPYMWNFYFALATPAVEDRTPVGAGYYTLGAGPFLFTPMSTPHLGNLGVAGVSSGQTIMIPPAIGQMTVPAAPVILPENNNWGAVGVISMLLENDWYTEQGIASGHAEMRMLIESQLRNTIIQKADQPFFQPAFRPSDVQDAILPLLRSGLPGQVKAAIRGAQSPLENLASFLHPDDLVGVQVFLWDMDQLTPAAQIPFRGTFDRRGRWELSGVITP